MKKLIIFLSILIIFVVKSFSQDLIYKRNGSKLNVKVEQITEKIIEYSKDKKFAKISISEVTAIFYADGTTKIFSTEQSSFRKITYSEGVIVPAESKINNSNEKNDYRAKSSIELSTSSECFVLVDARANNSVISFEHGYPEHGNSDKIGIIKFMLQKFKQEFVSRGGCHLLSPNGERSVIRLTKCHVERYTGITSLQAVAIVEIQIVCEVNGHQIVLGSYSGKLTRTHTFGITQKMMKKHLTKAMDNLFVSMGL